MNREKRDTILFGLTSMLNDISSELIYTVLPLYVKDPSIVGLIGGIFNGLGHAFKVVFGYLASRVGRRKPLIVGGYALSSLAKFGIYVSPKNFIPVMSAIDRIGKGMRDSSRDSILGSYSDKSWSFSVHRALDTLGALLGVLLAYYFVIRRDIKAGILFASIVSLFAIIPLIFVKEPKIRSIREGFVSSIEHLSTESKKMALLSIPVGFALISPMIFIEQASGVISKEAVLLYALFNVFYIFSSLMIGKKTSREHRKSVITLSTLFIALSLILLTMGKIGFIFAFASYGIIFGALLPNLFAFFSEIDSKPVAMGLFQTLFGISILLGSTLLGSMIKLIGTGAILYYSIIPVLSSLLFHFFAPSNSF